MFVIVDRANKSDPQEGSDPIQINPSNDKELYWKYVTTGRTPPFDQNPVLIVMFGPPGSGKSKVLRQFFKVNQQYEYSQFVHLDPDALRVCSKEYRLSLSGAHAKKLLSVQLRYGDKLTPTKLKFTLGNQGSPPVGEWVEDGYTVDGKYLALANTARRSTGINRQAMLWGYGIKEMTDAFTDRAFVQGYNIIYDTMGNEPNRFLKELMGRARQNHQYKVIVLGCYATWEQCKARCASRGAKQGRHVSESFLMPNYRTMFPSNLPYDKNGKPKEAAEEIDLTHFNAFKKELLTGDERYLYDNSGKDEEPTLCAEEKVGSGMGMLSKRGEGVERQKTMSPSKGSFSEKSAAAKGGDGGGRDGGKESETTTKRQEEMKALKKLKKDLTIHRGERDDMCVNIHQLHFSINAIEDEYANGEAEGVEWNEDDSEFVAGQKLALKEQQDILEAKEEMMVEWMKAIGKLEPFVIACDMLVVIERLEDRDQHMRRAAQDALEKVKQFNPSLLDDREYDALVGKLGNLPQRIFNNMADAKDLAPQLQSPKRRRDLCRIPAVRLSLIQDMSNGTWLLTRMSTPTKSKTRTVVEYFEVLSKLRRLSDSSDEHAGELDRFYRKVGCQLALPPKKWECPYTLFPALFAMTKKSPDGMAVIDELVGTPVLNVPLNLMVGQPCALIVILLDLVSILMVLMSTYRVAIEVADYQKDRTNAQSMKISADLIWVQIASYYALVREIVTVVSFQILGQKTKVQGVQSISAFTYLGNNWKLLNMFSAITSLVFAHVSADSSRIDWQVNLATWAVGMLWLRLLGFIRTLNINFATYVSCLLQILSDIKWFLMIMAATTLLFGSMLFIYNVEDNYADLAFKPPWAAHKVLIDSGAEVAEFDRLPFVNAYETILLMYRMLLGETHRYWFEGPMELSLYVVYELVVVILMLNVLIAVVGDSYEYSVIRARTTFVECRVELVVELETLGLTDPGCDWEMVDEGKADEDKRTIPGRINSFLRWANRSVVECVKSAGRTMVKAATKNDRRTHNHRLSSTIHAGRDTYKLQHRRLSAPIGGYNHLVDEDEETPSTEGETLEELHKSKRMKDGGLLGFFQYLIYMEEETIEMNALVTADTWLGRALDMERRTQKIVDMAETNIESTVEGKIDELKTAQQGLQENMTDIMKQLTEMQSLIKLGADTFRSLAPAPSAENPKRKK